jgi:2-polyprenyl-6-methoxyphenol hydroxylase-like FAD-dependent oxidoreductase
MSAPDLLVVGAGPAGLATALAARRRGLAVTVVERRRPPLDKPCGEGLMPAALAALARLEVAPPQRALPFRGIRYLADGARAEADFPGGARGLGARRTELSAALLAACATAGVELRFGVEATGLAAAGGVTTAGGEIRARWVAGADGLRSRVRRWAALERAPRAGAARRFGIVRHYRLPPWSDRVEVWFGARCEAYVTPLAADETGVAILGPGEGEGFDELLAQRLPAELARRLAAGRALGRDAGAGPFRQRVAARTARGVALVGDAAGYLDALTGEGLALGFEQALALAEALEAGDLARYERAASRLVRVPETLTRLALAAARRPALGRRVVAALAADPELFARLLGALGCREPWTAVGAAAPLRFLAALLVRPRVAAAPA